MILAMHVVAVLALDQVVAFDLAAPCQVFATARLSDGRRPYDVRVCAVPGTRATARGLDCFGLETKWTLETLASADTIVIPGHANCLDPVPAHVLDLLRNAAVRGARLVSICTGAFILAATGLLSGLRATTHWQFADELQRRHPDIDVDRLVLYIDNGQLLTSAGIAAGLDLCLHLIRRDHGAAVTADAARYVVTPPHRQGGQAQFIARPDPVRGDGTLQPILQWLQHHLAEPLTLTDIARQAATSVRSLNRHFQAETGTTPLQWLQRARVSRAQELLETTNLPVEVVARDAGFGCAAVLRIHFARHLGTSPKAYRCAFNG